MEFDFGSRLQLVLSEHILGDLCILGPIIGSDCEKQHGLQTDRSKATINLQVEQFIEEKESKWQSPLEVSPPSLPYRTKMV